MISAEENMPSSDSTAAKAIVPRINDEMMDAVRKWDEITLAFGRGGLQGWRRM